MLTYCQWCNGECSGLNCRDQTTVQFTTAGPCIVTGNDNVLIVYDVVKLSGLPSMLHSFSCGVEVSGTAGIWCTPQSISVMSTFQQVSSRQLTVCWVLRDSCLHGKCKYKLMYWIGCGCALWYIDIFNIASITDILRIIRSLLHMLERLSVYNWRTVDSTISRITADLIYIIFCYQTNARSSAVAERQHDAWCRCRLR